MTGSICPYCRTPIESEEEATPCPGCSTPHHTECWGENGGCTVFGCAEAPIEEAKITVSGGDFAYNGSPYAFGNPTDTTGVAPPPPAFDQNTSHDPVAIPFSHAPYSTLGLSEPFAGHSTLNAVGLAPRTDRKTYILLGFFFGYLGVHNMYANRMNVGIIQLCVTALTCFLASPATWIWALVEICTIDTDGNDLIMH